MLNFGGRRESGRGMGLGDLLFDGFDAIEDFRKAADVGLDFYVLFYGDGGFTRVGGAAGEIGGDAGTSG